MKEAKHTPGPWFTHREGFSSVYIEARIGGGMLQEVASCGPTNEGSDQQEANARLIAASPENFQSNLELAAIVRELCAAYGHPLPEDALARSDAAIAKATGRADSADGEQKGKQ